MIVLQNVILHVGRFGVHQGACSGILCARLLAYHAEESASMQHRIAQVLSANVHATKDESAGREKEQSAARLLANLVKSLPGVPSEHSDTGKVSEEALSEFAMTAPLERLNSLSPKKFQTAEQFLAALKRPLSEL